MKATSNLMSLLVAILVAGASLPALAHIASKQDAAPAAAEGVVNINSATVEQLSLLPGVGPTRAEAIIAARERRPFRAVNELIRVRGIGRATFHRLLPYITVSGETTLTQPVPTRRAE